MKTIKLCLLISCLSCLVACTQINVTNPLNGDRPISINGGNQLAETGIPKVIQDLDRKLEQYNPQVKILSPAKGKVISQTEVKVQLAVADLPLFRDDRLKLGNHLDLIVDNEPAREIYDLTEPIILKDLSPGTHSLRVFADRPWGESYKNEGAYAQTTFSIITETNDNHPDENLPLLTYSNPTGSYSAEPILLDFYLTNAPLHSVAQNDPNLADWRIKATVNGNSFLLENWQPVYLKGFNKGENWIQLELIDEEGKDIANTYNNTVRVINYNPQQTDTLGKLMSDRISAEEANPIVEQTYYIQPVGKPEAVETEEAEEPTVEENGEDETILSTEEEAPEVKEESLEKSNTVLEEPTIIPAVKPEINIKDIESTETEIEKTTIDSKEELVKPEEPTQTIVITEEDSTALEPIAEITIPQPEAVEITEDEIAITLPTAKNPNETKITPEKSMGWKKLLVTFRQKWESLVKAVFQ